jgi:prepilin signal peptidase PulO-like enzyme (type II secretory pathway)
LSFIIGGIFATLLLVSKKKKLGQAVPFGPFLVMGAVLAFVYGEQLWQWYWQFLL